jgi:carbamoylphosphate synthase small subunit
VNYDYIVKNLCENRNVPQSTCKGKCYVSKELAKTEKQSNNSQTVKIAGLDVFLSHDILSFLDQKESEIELVPVNSDYNIKHTSEYFSRIFHPPLS